MKVIHSGTEYECNAAVKCENDKYIKLYDANGTEIAAFHNISNFADYTISGGSFSAPCDCTMPITLSAYAIGGRTISRSAWISSGGRYYCEIANKLISGNPTTCNILLLFKDGTQFEYDATQADGKITLYVDSVPASDIVIEGIQITRV